MRTVLVAADEIVLRDELFRVLTEQGQNVLLAQNVAQTLDQVKNTAVQLIIADQRVLNADSTDFLRRLREIDAEVPFVVVVEPGATASGAEALRSGAIDYLMRPLISDELLIKINRIIETAELTAVSKMMRRELDYRFGTPELIGISAALDGIRTLIRKVAPTNSPVLITGEPGTGKELIARTIHASSGAKQEPFVSAQCAATPEYLLESELFGHRNGSIAGAPPESEGLLRSARGGTLFLDEVGDVPLQLQAKLLRALEDRRFQPVGTSAFVPFEARVVAATNRKLREEVDKKNFREDLYFQLAVLELHAPPLRDRRDDIMLLAQHFIRHFNRELKRNYTGIEDNAMRNLLLAPWKGNVRELQNHIERAMIVGIEPVLRVHDLLSTGQPPVMPLAEMKDLKDAVSIFERDHIRRIIAERHGDKRAAARDLGISLSSLYRHLDLKGPV